MDKTLEAEVRRRAGNRCEYCQIPESLFDVRHEIDHVIARQHRGETVLSNLALCCGRCNLSKGPNVASVDPASQAIVPLFNPREQRWSDHFVGMERCWTVSRRLAEKSKPKPPPVR